MTLLSWPRIIIPGTKCLRFLVSETQRKQVSVRWLGMKWGAGYKLRDGPMVCLCYWSLSAEFCLWKQDWSRCSGRRDKRLGKPDGGKKKKLSDDIPGSEDSELLAEKSLYHCVNPCFSCLSQKLLLIVSLSFKSSIFRKPLIGQGDSFNHFFETFGPEIFHISEYSVFYIGHVAYKIRTEVCGNASHLRHTCSEVFG